MAAPEPNSPEALRTAQKIRHTFFFIAAANLLLIAIIMWPRGEGANPPQNPPPTTEAADPATREMEATVDRILEGYRVRDAERFANAFSADANPAITEDYFRTVVIGDYDLKYGEILRRTLEVVAPDKLIHTVVTKKQPAVRMTTEFTREGGALKATRWSLETP